MLIDTFGGPRCHEKHVLIVVDRKIFTNIARNVYKLNTLEEHIVIVSYQILDTYIRFYIGSYLWYMVCYILYAKTPKNSRNEMEWIGFALCSLYVIKWWFIVCVSYKNKWRQLVWNIKTVIPCVFTFIWNKK